MAGVPHTAIPLRPEAHVSVRRHFVLALTASLLLASATAVVAREQYSLHLKVARQGGQSLDFAMPWDFVRGASPFDFVDDSHDRREVKRLRAAWDMLSKMPDDRSVIIHADGRRTRVWKHDGSLVLQPLDDSENARIRIPAEIVEAVLRHDGRLKTSDVDALLARRGGIALVDVESDEARVSVRIDRHDDERD